MLSLNQKILAYLLAVGLIFTAGFSVAWKIQSGNISDIKLAQSEGLVEQLTLNESELRKQITNLNSINSFWRNKSDEYQKSRDKLNSDIASGKYRVYLKAVCPRVQTTNGSTQLPPEETRPQLTPETYQRVDSYRAELNQLLIDYSELQDWAIEVTKCKSLKTC